MKSTSKIVGLMILSTFVCGCAGSSLLQTPARLLPGRHKGDTATPARILCLWQAAEGQGLDGRPARGFAGQVLFFGYGQAEPIEVHGRVRISMYDDFDPDELNPRPVHIFEFDDEGWNVHQSMSTLGHSYNVFLPYVLKHPETAYCALKVELLPEDSPAVTSSYSEITLPSRRRSPRPSATRTSTARSSGTRAAGYTTRPAHEPAAAATVSRQDTRVDTLTIPLPTAVDQ